LGFLTQEQGVTPMGKTEKRLCRTCGTQIIHHLTNTFNVSRFVEKIEGSGIENSPEIKVCPFCKRKLNINSTCRPQLADVQDFFFEAMRQGWVVSTTAIPGFLPGYEMIPYQRGLMKLIDHWYKTSGESRSMGSTHIYFGETLLWAMTYEGYYQQEALPVVLSALLHAYETKQFFGGRGIPDTTHKNLVYVNRLESNSFQSASGVEEVFSGKKSLGKHTYRCHWMW
jgi:hypothetical protein